MEPLKNIYANKKILLKLAEDMKVVYPKLDERDFSKTLTLQLEELELKARFGRVADTCREFLPKKFPEALGILRKFIAGKENKYIYIFLPTFVAKYGRAHYELSMQALRDFTQYSSSEEGIRIFLEDNLKSTLQHMLFWTRSKNTHIRRLASEGSRPRLPWAKKVLALVENPRHAWPILEALKADPEKYVQKSVANHINDISKDHPDWVVKKVSAWNRKSPITAWIVKHGMRTLIKKGHRGALKLFGHHEKPKVKIRKAVWQQKMKLGGVAAFSFEMVSASAQKQRLVIDYQLYFSKKDGKLKPKTFKLKHLTLNPGETVKLQTKYGFKDFTTRRHYAGKHAWQPLINGEPFEIYPFHVTPPPR